MSKVAIKGNASGTGTFTIESPNSNTDRTLVLPDEAGTVLTSASGASLSGADFTGQVTVQTADASGQTPSADADELVLENNGNAGMTFVTSDGGTGSVRWNSATGSDYASIRANYGDNELRLSQNNSSGFVRIDTNGTERMRIDPTYIYFGTTTSNPTSITNGGGMAYHVPSGLKIAAAQDTCLRLNRTENSSGNIASFFFDATEVGRITVNGSSTSYVTSSDYRLKENVVDMTDAITRVKQLSPKRFNFIADADDTTVDGFLAHEAQTVVPEAVEGTHNEVDVDGNPVMQGIDQSKLVPLLTGALQEAIAKIETLETTVADLQTRVTALEATP